MVFQWRCSASHSQTVSRPYTVDGLLARAARNRTAALRPCGDATLTRLTRVINLLNLVNSVNIALVNPSENPYTPNAGARPPALVGRSDQLESFDRLLERLRRGRSEQSMLITGLRGVGKTVLLGEFERRAQNRDWVTVDEEIKRNPEFRADMASLVSDALFQLAPRKRWRQRAHRAAAIVASFRLTMSTDGQLSAGVDLEAARELANTGNLERDFTTLLVALGEAAQEQESGVVFLFDEAQFFELPQLEALIAGLHKTVQRQLPITLVGAGLPQLPRLAGEAKSYAERLFTFPSLGQLNSAQAERALVEPAEELGVAFSADAVKAIIDYTEGYPYFIQEYGKLIWDIAQASPITLRDAKATQSAVQAKLDASFFKVRAERTTELELDYLRAMAELGPESQSAKAVAERLGKTSRQLATIRARLIEKGLLYTASHGFAAFTVPQFDRYLLRSYELN